MQTKPSLLIGGMGPESTLTYYKQLNCGFQNVSNKQHDFPSFVLESVNLRKMLQFCTNQDYPGLCSFLLNAIHNVANAGATFAALGSNTSHIVFEELAQLSPIPLVSIVEYYLCRSTKEANEKSGITGNVFYHAAGFLQKAISCRRYFCCHSLRGRCY